MVAIFANFQNGLIFLILDVLGSDFSVEHLHCTY